MTKVVNIKKEPCDIKICRPSKWGNPYIIGKDGNRAEVIKKYHMWIIHQKELMDSLHELEGKKLGCFCSPLSCHGDVLLYLIRRIKQDKIIRELWE